MDHPTPNFTIWTNELWIYASIGRLRVFIRTRKAYFSLVWYRAFYKTKPKYCLVRSDWPEREQHWPAFPSAPSRQTTVEPTRLLELLSLRERTWSLQRELVLFVLSLERVVVFYGFECEISYSNKKSTRRVPLDRWRNDVRFLRHPPGRNDL